MNEERLGQSGGRKGSILALHGSGSPGGKESACNAGDLGSILGLGRSPGERNGNPLQYSCLENPMDGGAWWLQSMGSQRMDMTEQLTLVPVLRRGHVWVITGLRASGSGNKGAQEPLRSSFPCW